jgi:zinc transport system ATP-binding protein
MSQIKCEKLTLGYGSQEILSGLSFEVNRGDYLCIVGSNGSGKTTLMKTVLGLTKPLGGSIEFSDGLSASGIGYLPQQTDVQRDFPASVYEIVISGCLGRGGFHPFYTKADKALAAQAMERMDIKGLKNSCYRELSGGQQQRVLLARALCATRDILLLDEPVAGLDPKVTADMYALIDSLNKNDGVTVIMISHDIDKALKYASHILHIGTDIFFGTRAEYEVFKANRNGG